MKEILKGRQPYLIESKGVTEAVLLDTIYEIEGFHLKAFSELEAFFDEPEPYLELDLSSAAVIARITDSNSILLVEFGVENGRRVELPAGKVEKGVDRTIADTATREFIEETGGMIALQYLEPFSVSCHEEGRGGLQFYSEIPELRVESMDELGRGYLTPSEGIKDEDNVIRLITEPLDVFLDKERTLLRYSQNPWAVDEYARITTGMHAMELDVNTK